MEDEPFKLPLNVRGQLDTNMPVSDRPPGTLVAASDCHPQRWGPKEGSGAFTRAWESPGTVSLYDEIRLVPSAAQARAQGRSFEDTFGDLGTTFTLDLWFRLEATAYAIGQDRIGVYFFQPGQAGSLIEVNIFGPSHVDAGKIEVQVTTCINRSTADTTIILKSVTAITSGTDAIDKQHLRVVRDGKNLYLYLNGVLDNSTATLSATHPINRAYNKLTIVGLGTSISFNTFFYGRIYGAILRDGVFTSQPIEAVMPCSPWAKNVHHYYLGRSIALGGADHFMDLGHFATHARIIGTDYTVTSSNDDTTPAPAPVQMIQTWTTRKNRVVASVMVGGQISTVAGA